jgi:hypothetical protein
MGMRNDLSDPRLYDPKLVGKLKLTVNPSVAATGTNLATARAVAPGITKVTASNGTRAVKLTTPVLDGDGEAYFVKNTVATTGATLPVFPPAADHSIDGATAGAAASVGLGAVTLFINSGPKSWTTVAF